MRWEYCECGCHGHESGAGGTYFWLYNDLKGNLTLYRGHGFYGEKLGTYKEWEDADNKANEIMEQAIKKMKESMYDKENPQLNLKFPKK